MSRTKRSALGKGLNALIAAPRFKNIDDTYFMCPVTRLQADPDQPRKRFDDRALDELVASIKEKGILQPLVVRTAPQGVDVDYIVIAGERRLRAARRAGLLEVPVLVKDVASDEALELALIENIQREDLDPIEEAHAYRRLITERAYRQEVLASRLGKSRSTIANALRLLRLSQEHQALVAEGTLSAGHARALLVLDHDDDRDRLAKRIQKESLSVRQTERMAKRMAKGGPRARKANKPWTFEPYCRSIATDLTRHLEVEVEVKLRGASGHLLIPFSGVEELRRLSDRLLPAPPGSST